MTQVTDSGQPLKSNTSSTLEFLLVLTGFLVPCGEELSKIVNFDMAKLYVASITGLIVYWVLVIKGKFVFPKYLNLFFLFIFLHTLITYSIFFRDGFTFIDPRLYVFSNPDPHFLTNSYERTEAIGISILRQFVFALSGFAFCAVIQSKRQLFHCILGYSFGLGVVSAISLSSLNISAGDRLSGGVLDPNAFGFSGAMLVFLAATAMAGKEINFLQKLFLLFSFVLGIAVVLSSASRGALLGLVLGFVVILRDSKFTIKKIITLIFGFIVIIVLFEALKSQTQTADALSDEDRYSISGALSDHGAGRTDIWRDYLHPDALRKYFVTGTGFGRTTEAIRETYTYKFYVPHNNYLGILVDYGFIGFGLFCLAMTQIWKNIQVPTIRGLFMMWLVAGFFLDTFASRETWIILGIVCCCVAQKPWSETENTD